MNRFLILLVILCLGACQPIERPRASLIDYVDPFIGTAGKGKTYPGASMPFGMVQLSPDNGRNGWDWISGYFYPDTVISGFSHTHLSGTGAGDLYDISYFPTSGPTKFARLDDINPEPTIYSRFSHENESASPGYYQVYLEDYQVNVELTATRRTGLQRYRFDDESQDHKIRLDLGYSRNWDKTTDGMLVTINDSTVVGYRHSTGWAKNQRIYFISVFSKPIVQYQNYLHGSEKPYGKMEGTDILTVYDFGKESEVMVKTAISSVSIDRARQNLLIEQTGFNFEQVRSAAAFKWEVELSKVKIEASEEDKVKFYTASYHSMLAPTLYSDVNGDYRGTNNKIYHTMGYQRYSTFSLWDTYRALHPWMTITQTKEVPDILKSFLAFQEESGKLPVWTMMGRETNMMIGYHAVPVLTDAIKKGFTVDTLKAYEAMKVSAMQDDFGLKSYKELGYVPFENKDWNVSLTLEYAYDDWCIAQIAKLLGEEEDYLYFTNRSKNYLNHFDSETGFFRAKSKSGSFKEPFDPLAYHPSDYCEANAWQYLWYAPHDIEGLINQIGGSMAFKEKLEQMFETEQVQGASPEWISGYIGQYVHGNEPSHHVPYLFQYADAAGETQKRVRQIMNDLYSVEPDGLAGNEDCGQLSAWYLFSALGFYPVNPADGKYILGSPMIESATIQLPNKKTFKIIAKNQSKENVYVKSVRLNSNNHEDFFITHEQIMNGGELVFEMSTTP
ncbi:MAG: GH92 family glycosyl hydrolase [Cyclobacteriaceae bacterium]